MVKTCDEAEKVLKANEKSNPSPSKSIKPRDN